VVFDARTLPPVERNPRDIAIPAGLRCLRSLDSKCNETAEFASAALFRFGLDTLATAFWIARVATDEWLRGEGSSSAAEAHIPSSLERAIAALPQQAQKMFDEIVKSGFVDDSQRTLLKDILNPATHGDALVNVGRIGSFAAQGKNWAQYRAHS